MASVTTIRVGLKTRLAAITTFKQTHATAPGTIVTPCAIVLPGPIEYDSTMARGSDDHSFEILVLVAKATDQLGQEHLDPYLAGSGDQSVKRAVDDDTTAIDDVDPGMVRVARCSNYGDIDYNGVQYLGARFDVEVFADGA